MRSASAPRAAGAGPLYPTGQIANIQPILRWGGDPGATAGHDVRGLAAGLAAHHDRAGIQADQDLSAAHEPVPPRVDVRVELRRQDVAADEIVAPARGRGAVVTDVDDHVLGADRRTRGAHQALIPARRARALRVRHLDARGRGQLLDRLLGGRDPNVVVTAEIDGDRAASQARDEEGAHPDQAMRLRQCDLSKSPTRRRKAPARRSARYSRTPTNAVGQICTRVPV